ncbi:hypothetical protein CAL26_23700 [Bordetella genomosp. 9]|uniref:Uncharacterized protein n=1 Tax=Bordetella genomosp. 9 TaxID=1416803 RepID=A0A261R761_9BORD|nr:hypothetical protein [Bordetella genomosp. 9]OZI20502.1 hypothetical protein CAL26_23700 [Bordetella genomosp. 9]
MEYRQQQGYDGVVATQDDGSILWIANNPGDQAWTDYLAWVDSGNVPAPAPDLPVIVPQSVTRYQGEVYMRRIGIWASADSLFSQMADDDERKIAWLRAPTFNRSSPALNYACEQMGISDEQRDTMFIEANKIV